ncbi:MAG: alkaline phosphatase D family protein [Planctomycetota bacterium]|jgi:alkaline phosphatase D
MINLRIVCLLAFIVQPGLAQETRQATGVKVGEVSDTSAIVWVRLTKETARNSDGILKKGGRPKNWKEAPNIENVDELRFACPGAAGKVRLRYGPQAVLDILKPTPWVKVSAENDFTHQFKLKDLIPGTVYAYTAETAGPDGKAKHGILQGKFETAARPNEYMDVTFTVITGQAYKDLDHPDGYHIYEAMGKLKPKFIVPTGDTVYYDNEAPVARTLALARYHWHRMYSLPRHIKFHLQVPGYWMVDDHDLICNDFWPGMDTKLSNSMLPMNFEKGKRTFREQVPMGEKTYRTYCWGKGLQVWLVEGREFRSANDMPDGPGKSIWGAKQKQWLMKSLMASDADWKVLISQTPIVGPDRPKGKRDNYSNTAFAHEGNEIRRWFQKHLPDNFFVACGDRHWQYHSVHPETGVHEFSCGPASDKHAEGTPGYDPVYHKYHNKKGGFLSVSVKKTAAGSQIAFRHHDVHGKVVYEYKPVKK